MDPRRFSDPLTDRIIHCVARVHQTLGPGFLESVYRNALLIELRNSGLNVEQECAVGFSMADRKWDSIGSTSWWNSG